MINGRNSCFLVGCKQNLLAILLLSQFFIVRKRKLIVILLRNSILEWKFYYKISPKLSTSFPLDYSSVSNFLSEIKLQDFANNAGYNAKEDNKSSLKDKNNLNFLFYNIDKTFIFYLVDLRVLHYQNYIFMNNLNLYFTLSLTTHTNKLR